MPSKRDNGLKIFLISCFLFTILLASLAAHNTGALWADFHDTDRIAGKLGFAVVSVNNDVKSPRHPEHGLRKFGIRPIPWAKTPSMEEEELVIQEVSPQKDEQDEEEKTQENVVWTEVEVSAGETLSVISSRYKGVSAQNIAAANGLKNQNSLRQGQRLYIPHTESHVSATLNYVKSLEKLEQEARKKAVKLKITYYVVKDGDSLWGIANTFNLDVNTLFGSNTFKNVDMLKPGATIRIPNQDGTFIKVKKNDTLASIAKKYGSHPDAIAETNELNQNKPLTEGTELFVPGAKPMAVIETGNASNSNNREQQSQSRGFIWPLRGKVNSGFGWRRDPFNGRRDFHTGIDIKGPTGRNIVASASGRVVHAGWMSGYGKTIVVSHGNGMTTLYAHCSSLTKGVGRTVKQGEVIAKVGNTGRSTGSHLHFEIRINGNPVNPTRRLR